jgi:hypothetical protein
MDEHLVDLRRYECVRCGRRLGRAAARRCRASHRCKSSAGPHLTGFESDQKRGEGEGGRSMEEKWKKKGDSMA